MTKSLNNFSHLLLKSFNIPNYENYNSLSKDVDYPTLMAIVKWRNHLNIFAIAPEHINIIVLFVLFSKRILSKT